MLATSAAIALSRRASCPNARSFTASGNANAVAAASANASEETSTAAGRHRAHVSDAFVKSRRRKEGPHGQSPRFTRAGGSMGTRMPGARRRRTAAASGSTRLTFSGSSFFPSLPAMNWLHGCAALALLSSTRR